MKYMRKLYNDIETAIRSFKYTLDIDSIVGDEVIYDTIHQVMYNNPEIFWFSYQWEYVENHSIHFRYSITKRESEEIQSRINDIIDNDFQIQYVRTLSDLEKVVYVYKWLIYNCNYNTYSAYNQSIYSVFILRNSLCTGYAKAAQYLFRLLDIECDLVYGHLTTDMAEGRHCWNLVKIENKFYHLDVCFGDPTLDKLQKGIGVPDIWRIGDVNYNMFCISSEEICNTHTVESFIPIAEESLDCQLVKKLAELPIRHRNEIKGCLLSSKGNFADVFLCTSDKGTVLKCSRQPSERCIEEYKFMDRLRNCPHLLHVKDEFCNVSDGILAIEQAVPVTDLIKSPDSCFTLKDSLTMIRDVAEAVDECYWNSVYYRDIHLNNIYKCIDGTYRLGDFGSCTWAVQVDSLLVKEIVEGDPWFVAPETFNQGVFSLSSATYSLSLILYFVLNDLTPPFWDIYPNKRAYEVRHSGRTIPPIKLSFGNDITKTINDFLEKGLAFEEGGRFRGIQEFISNIEHIIDILSERDYILIEHNDSFNCVGSTKVKGFNEDNITDYSNTSDECGEEIETDNIVTAQIECPNCHYNYEVNIIQSLVENIKPMLSSNFASGGLSVLKKDTDFMECPNCHYQSSIAECVERNKLTLPPNNKIHSHDDSIAVACGTIDLAAASRQTKGSYDETSTSSKRQFSYQPRPRKSFWKKLLNSHKQDNVVFSSIFAPSEVKRQSHMMIQLYLHLFEETYDVVEMAQAADMNAERRDYIPLQCKLRRGDKVDVQLCVYGDTLMMSDKKNLIWQGAFTKCSFDFYVPKNINVEELYCMAIISVNAAQIGEMRFITKIVEKPHELHTAVFSRQYNKIFISYAHQDEEKVKYIAKAYDAQGVDYFFDRHYLKPGDIFPMVIKEYIDSADLFILCWSANAAQSKYVELERRQALERAFPKIKPFEDAPLSIYPMSIEPHADLPEDMRDTYNFVII